MQRDAFSIGNALTVGWEAFKKEAGVLIAVTVIFMVLSGGINFTFQVSYEVLFEVLNIPLIVGATLLGILINVFLQIGLIKVTLSIIDGRKGDVGELFGGAPHFLKVLGASLLYGLIVMGGLILLIVPGIIWGIKYFFFDYLIIDEDRDIVEAFRKSGEITRGQLLNLFLFGLLMGVINMGGAMLCGVGIIFTMPITMMAVVYVYRMLNREKDPGSDPGSGLEI